MSNRETGLQGSTSLPNPSAKWLEWDSKKKNLKFWDGEAKENANIKVGAERKLLYLGERSTVTGFDSDSNSRIYSNDVVNTGIEALTIKSKRGLLVSGFYKDIKGQIEAIGAKYTKRIYFVMDGQIVNLVLKGDMLAQWMNFTKAFPRAKPEWLKNAVLITGTEAKKSGGNNYNVPIFGFGSAMTAGEVQVANEAYDTLETYFTSRKESIGKGGQDEQDFIGDSLPSSMSSSPQAPVEVEVDDDGLGLPF